MASPAEKLDNCEVCAAAKAKYTCPKCEVRTCGLACVNTHKKELECDGIRDKTKFIPLNSFTDLDLLSDYRLLEDLGRSVETLRQNPLKRCTRENKLLPVHLQRLKKAAHSRQVNLEFMPQNFSRHKNNTTYFKWKENELLWKIEFIFIQAENLRWIEDRVIETKRLSELLEEIFNSEPKTESNVDESSTKLPVLQNKLKYYKSSGLSGIKVLLKAEKVKRSDSRFYELDLTQTIQENLRNKTIIEYPIIYVVLKDHFDMFDKIDSDEEVECKDIQESGMRTNNTHIKYKTDNNTDVEKETKKQKTESSLNYFFNANSSDSEDEDRENSNCKKKKNCGLVIPDYNELVKMEYEST